MILPEVAGTRTFESGKTAHFKNLQLNIQSMIVSN